MNRNRGWKGNISVFQQLYHFCFQIVLMNEKTILTASSNYHFKLPSQRRKFQRELCIISTAMEFPTELLTRCSLWISLPNFLWGFMEFDWNKIVNYVLKASFNVSISSQIQWQRTTCQFLTYLCIYFRVGNISKSISSYLFLFLFCFFLPGFSVTTIQESQDSKGRRTFL